MKKPACLDPYELFFQKYPQIAFLLKFAQKKERNILQEDIQGRLFYEKPELIVFTDIQAFKEEKVFAYLKEQPKTKIIVIEKDLEAFFWFLEQPFACEVILNDQIELYSLLKEEKIENLLHQLLEKNPTDRIFLYPETEELKLFLLRKATLSSSFDREDQYYHLLFRNLFKNFRKIHHHFYADDLKNSFEGIPAIICGAGPSLTKEIPFLKGCQNKALIFAGGSTITALTSCDIIPHIGLALDPNREEYERLYPGSFFEMPLLYTPRLQPEVFSLFNGKAGYLRTASGGLFQKLLEEQCELKKPSLQEGLTEDAMSVTTMAISAATHLGCSPILLVGIDLAYTGGKAYADGVVEDPSALFDKLKEDQRAAEKLFIKTNGKGKKVYTNTKWIMESDAISAFIQSYPKVQFLDCNQEGLGFSEVEKIGFEEAIQKHLIFEYDVKNRVHVAIESATSLSSKKQTVLNFYEELYQSLVKTAEFFENSLSLLKDEKLSQNTRETLLLLNELDSKEELAFKCFLKQVQTPYEKNSLLEIQHFLNLLEHYKVIFSNYCVFFDK